ncbi:MAG: radical SAM protein [Clostridiaceae bacterium]
MNRLTLNIRVTGCPNRCFHCHSRGGSGARALMEIDTIKRVASCFREALHADVSVLPLDEQTLYPDFIELITALEAEGFLRKDPSKFLVTNCWGLKHIPGLVDEVKKHYSTIVPTLFGMRETHDEHADRKGSYLDILEATKACIEKGIGVSWHLQWSKRNTSEINGLHELGESLGVGKIFISAEYFFAGYFPNVADEYLPVLDELSQIKHEVYEYQMGYLKTAAQFLDGIRNGAVFKVNKVPLDELYIDEKLNVYPFLHRSEPFCLGNLEVSPDRIIAMLKTESGLPEAIKKRREQDFSELVLMYANTSSNQLYTPQALFDRLCSKVL